MINAVIDTNVIVAALMSHHPDSATVKTLGAVVDGRVAAIVSSEILSEYQEVLTRDKFGFPSHRIASVLKVFENLGTYVLPKRYRGTLPDEKDRVFYEVALAEPGTRLVTGNLKHFPTSPIVVTPAQFCMQLGI